MKRAISVSTEQDELLRWLALLVVTVFVALGAYGLLTPSAWQVPVEYGLLGYDADALGILAHIKAAADGNFPLLLSKKVPELGAPFSGNWDDFPLVEQSLYWFTGQLARVSSLFVAANLMVVLAHVLAAFSFYVVCRTLRCDWRLAFAGALVFAFARYPFARQLHHLQVLYYWHVPACLLVGWWIAEEAGLRFGTRRFWMAIGIAVITGIQHPYYTNMFVQLTGAICLSQWLRGQRESARAGAVVIAVTMASFFVMCGNYFVHKLIFGGNPEALVRAFHWLEFSALKPLDMVMPPPDHRLAAFSEFSQNYHKSVMVPGEFPPSSYLGLIGIVALAWLVTAAVRCATSRPPRVVPLEAWQVLWIVLYSVVGGFNCFAGVMGVQLFRSSNRYSIFVLAIVLIWAIRRLSDLRMATRFVVPLSIAAVCVALWDQAGRVPAAAQMAALRAVVESDREFSAAMEEQLPPGAMVFQLPFMLYPESPAPGVSAYDHFRPYLYTRRLRYAFGSAKGRPTEQWQLDVAKSDVPQAVRALEGFGFAALYINRAGFQDRGAQLIKQLDELGLPVTLASKRGDLIMVRLKPVSPPHLPPAGSS